MEPLEQRKWDEMSLQEAEGRAVIPVKPTKGGDYTRGADTIEDLPEDVRAHYGLT